MITSFIIRKECDREERDNDINLRMEAIGNDQQTD